MDNDDKIYEEKSAHGNMKVPSGTKNGSSERCQRRTFHGVSKNLKQWFFKAPFLVPQRTFQTRVL